MCCHSSEAKAGMIAWAQKNTAGMMVEAKAGMIAWAQKNTAGMMVYNGSQDHIMQSCIKYIQLGENYLVVPFNLC